MGFCPKCKYEFREGIKVCSDCGCELVDDLSLVCENDEEETNPAEEFVFVYDEEKREEIEEAVRRVRENHVYVNNEEKAEEHKTSAVALLAVGFIGLSLMILFFIGVIPSSMSAFGKYMMCAVMGALFVLFIVMGFVSFKNSKDFSTKADSENNLTNEIKKYLNETINKETFDDIYGINAENEELKYFDRFKKIKELIYSQFMNLDDSYVERLIDEIYQDLFE